MKKNYFFTQLQIVYHKIKFGSHYQMIITCLVLFCFSFSGYAQKDKAILPLVCVKKMENGLYQATFSYENPTKKEVVIDENGSIIKSNNGKRVAKGLNKFKPGVNKKAFTKEFGAGDFIVWTITSNGKTHEVVANVNSGYCEPDKNVIEPVIGNGKSFDIIGQELTSLCEDVAGEAPSNLIFQIVGDKVLVEIVPIFNKMPEVIELLQGPPFNRTPSDFLLNLNAYNGLSAVDVYIEPGKLLCELNLHEDIINFARPAYPAKNNTGGVKSKGDGAQTSNLVRDSFRMKNADGTFVTVDGSDITVGILSDSYNMFVPGGNLAGLDISAGELPDDNEVVVEDSRFKASDEGRAMAQIIHDVAPGATLKFHTATASPRQFEVAFDKLAAYSDIIVDDITFITEPFFGEGRISKAIQSFVNSAPEKFHFTSAGNFANKGYQSVFNPTSTAPVTNFIDPSSTTVAHDFNKGAEVDYLQKISVVKGTYLIALQWQEPVASQDNNNGALQDLDIYIVDDFGRLLVGSNRVNDAGDPTEIIVFRATGSGEANILITNANGANNPNVNVPFRYIAFRTSGDDNVPDGLKFEEYFNEGINFGAPTVSGHAMTPESVTVGAVDYRYADNPVAEGFSSYGGQLSDNTTEVKIDLYAPDGGNIASKSEPRTIGLGIDAQCDTCDKDGFLNFYGTSASAPHAAGAAALLMSAAKSWFPDGFPATKALSTFKGTATTFSTPDGSGGAFLNTFEAFKSIAAPLPKILGKLKYDDGVTPSQQIFEVYVYGESLPVDIKKLKVLFDDKELENVEYFTRNDSTFISATVPTFFGNPKLVIVTEGNTPGGTDGGESNPAYFFDDGKIALNIIANNATFKFGQDIGPSYYRPDKTDPDYVPPFFVEGLPEGVTYESLELEDGLPPVVLNDDELNRYLGNEGNGYPIAGLYIMKPSFGDAVLSDVQQEKYQINFISGYLDDELGEVGYLTINKNDLIIKPNVTQDYTYGDIIDIKNKYLFDDPAGIKSPADFYAEIEAAHQDDFYAQNTLALVNSFKGLANGYDYLELLNGGSWIATERTIFNSFKGLANGMDIVELDISHFTDYIDAKEAQGETNAFKGLANAFKGLANAFKGLANAADLFDPNVEVSFENSFKGLANGSDLGGESDNNDYSSVFAIIDETDFPTQENQDVEISRLYALNLITGLEVTSGTDGHYIYPGAFLNAMAANFNITYDFGEITIKPKDLTVSIPNFTIEYGDALTKARLLEDTTVFEDWAYGEDIATYFAEDEQPFEFVKDGQRPYKIGDLKDLGEYAIKLKALDNYNIETVGTLTIAPATLTFTAVSETIIYGETPVIEPEFGGFGHGELKDVLKVNGQIPYYFMKDGATFTMAQLADMNVGVYEIFIKDYPNDNYVFSDTKVVSDTKLGTLTIAPATLTFTAVSETIDYGETPVIEPEFGGFGHGELKDVLKVNDQIPYYFMKDGATFTMAQLADMNVGVYEIFIKDYPNDNYVFNDTKVVSDTKLGTLTIAPATLTFTAVSETIDYGETPVIEPEFGGFGHGELKDVLKVNDQIPYYFMKDGATFTMAQLADMNVGVYEIFIKDYPNDNYVFSDTKVVSDTKIGTLTINKATLSITITPEKLIINQGDIPDITASFDGFGHGESEDVLKVNGQIPYYYLNGNTMYYSTDVPGAYTVQITAPTNYTMVYSNEATLLINSIDNVRKVRTFSDCVKYNGPEDYTVIFRYENDNDEVVYVAVGSDNELAGGVLDDGRPPAFFMPGGGTFEIRFNGQQLTWSLTTFGSTNKSSVSSANQSDTGECGAKIDGASYTLTLYPNPVTDGNLTIEQSMPEISTVYILDMYGRVLYTDYGFDGITNTVDIDMSDGNLYPSAMYVVRIVSQDQVRTYNIIKQ
ncbi:S8 family peptidase [Lutimonas halocynthiae]|uniref:S8 family peptidase n=1 Tax=Lutimonas halocynthiae TaxID=1446477 RepID=UPI0025B2ECB0|nr:S8 family peptidase [Lutimonas halocynthiae]MDN3641676.1 S8 family peptidase [Lutimonas halocynthiae]